MATGLLVVGVRAFCVAAFIVVGLLRTRFAEISLGFLLHAEIVMAHQRAEKIVERFGELIDRAHDVASRRLRGILRVASSMLSNEPMHLPSASNAKNSSPCRMTVPAHLAVINSECAWRVDAGRPPAAKSETVSDLGHSRGPRRRFALYGGKGSV